MGSTISIPIGDVVAPCWNCTATHAMHGCDLGESIKSLTNNWVELMSLMNDVKRRIDNEEQEGPHMKRLDQVQEWISRVERLDREVEELKTRSTQEIEMTCSRGCCPKNCIRRYKLGKKAAQKLQEVADLKIRGQFNSVVDKVPSKPGDERFIEPTVGLESPIDEVWKYITEDDQVGIIGLYGMGGVGKTTLLTEINNRLAKAAHEFNFVIWVRVPKEPNNTGTYNFGKLQEEIGKKIGYRDTMWTNKSQDEKAEDISRVLREKKFVLLLDDIWKEFDLGKVGVPFPNEENKSKVVFTTRSDVMCGLMGAKKWVHVKCLAPDEAWDLFNKRVGEYAIRTFPGIKDNPEILNLAKLVVQECDGLPLALITIGRAMACKNSPEEWSHALTLLRKNAARFTGMEDKVFRLLKFSYDELPSEAERACFLYCSLFPEDLYIPKQKLINYWLGEGFLDEYDKFDQANLEGYYIIGTLVHACLLEEDENDGVKMHDVIRDMALWIACERGRAKDKYLVQAHAGLIEAPELPWKGIERMSLMSNHITTLTEAPSCHNLLTLFLNDNRLNMIAHGFFQSMRALRVLDLSVNEGIAELPEEISLLVSLQYLNLSGTSITKLPVALKSLKRLKYLDLTYCNHLHEIPEGLISSFKYLQVLKMFGCGSSDLLKEESPFWGRQESFLEELTNLRYLNDLSITIQSSIALWSSHSLYMSKIRRLGWSHLKVDHFPIHFFTDQTKNLQRLEIADCEFESSFLRYSDMINKPQFHSLRSVFVVRCSKLKDLTFFGCAQNLELLVIAYCKDITEIVDHDFDSAVLPFSRLRELYLIELPQLRHVYSRRALPFPCLKFIGVEGCPMLRDLPLDSESAKGCGLTIQGYEDWWNGLTWNGEASFCLVDAKEEKMKKPESSTSTSTSTADASLPYFKSMKKPESSSSSSTSTSTADAFLPYFKSFD